MRNGVASVAVIGLGYVGIVNAVCLAKQGYKVIGVDIDQAKVESLNNRFVPIYEPGLEKFLDVAKTNLEFTTDIEYAVKNTDLCFVCVGTPSTDTGNANLEYVKGVSEDIGYVLKTHDRDMPYTVCFRSTIPPGTSEELIIPSIEDRSGKKSGRDFYYAFNPEFLREGNAINDFFNPSFTIIGANPLDSSKILTEVYRDIPGDKILTSVKEAELVKYVSNIWHALKICFANEIGVFANKVGIDSRRVMEIFCNDEKLNISKAYLKPGFAFGGSCLPKDLKGFISMCKSRSESIELPLIESILTSNNKHIERSFSLIDGIVGADNKRIAVVGLAFKSGTDDIRESAPLYLVELLIKNGYDVKLYDPQIKKDRLFDFFNKRNIPFYSENIYSNMEELLNNEKAIVFTGTYRDLTINLERYKDKYIFDLGGLFYENPDIKRVCKYYSLC